MRLSSRLQKVQPSATIALSDRVKDLVAGGEQILRLEVGQSCLGSPAEAVTAACDSLRAGETFYGHSRGLRELRAAICELHARRHGVALPPDRHILVTPGCKQAILYLFLAMLDDGDEVLVPTPAWPSYGEIARIAGGEPVFVPCGRSCRLDVRELAEAVTPRTRAIIVGSPGNPSGVVFDLKTMQEILALCRRHDLYLVSDEIYDRVIFAGYSHTSVLAVDPGLEHSILLNGFSKAYAMPGWRLGYLLARPEMVTATLTLQQNSATHPTTFAQRGAVGAIYHGEDFIASALETYQCNRDLVCSTLDRLPQFSYVEPEGGMYVFLDVSKTGLEDEAFCLDVLEHCRASLTPGSAFGPGGERFARLCIAVSRVELETFLSRLAARYP